MINRSVNKKPLTNEQKELVTENHNLIYAYAHKKDISLDEYYGILAIGLCKAAKAFDKSKGEFSTIAYRCMENELCTYWKSMQSKSTIPEDLILSYDNGDYDNQNNFLENYPDCQASESVMYAIISSEFIESLNDKEKEVVNLLMDGLTHREIANKLECKRQNIGYYVKQIRNKANDYLNNN